METDKRIKNLQDILEVLESEIVIIDKGNKISAIERDILLEKLRKIYEILLGKAETRTTSSVARNDIGHPEVENEGNRDDSSTAVVIEPDETSMQAGTYHEQNGVIPGNGTPGNGTPGDGTPGNGTPGAGTPGAGTPGISSEEAVPGEEDLQAEIITEEDPAMDETRPGNNEEPSTEKGPEIIAEKYQSDQKFVNESVGKSRPGQDLSSKLQTKPINDISKAIGINDKFLFVKELFDGNAAQFDKTIKVLNDAANFNDAFNYLNENYNWEMDSSSVQKLLDLARRKFIIQNEG
jgi:hypothetical protein